MIIKFEAMTNCLEVDIQKWEINSYSLSKKLIPRNYFFELKEKVETMNRYCLKNDCKNCNKISYLLIFINKFSLQIDLSRSL